MEHSRSSKPIDVSVIIVSFNGQEKLRECLRTLFKESKSGSKSALGESTIDKGSTECKEPSRFKEAISLDESCVFEGLQGKVVDTLNQVTIEVFVSDNGSSDSSVEMVRNQFPSVGVIENNANLGFAAANNRALVKCSGRYIMLLNPDTVFIEDSISKMVRFMDDNAQVGICGPRLLNGDGSLQFSARNFPSVPNQLAESLALRKLFPNSRKLSELILDQSFYFDTGKPAGGSGEKASQPVAPKRAKTTARHALIAPSYVDWVTGAALMIRRAAFNDIGLLDERFFMYSEEKDWCYRAHLKGWPVALYPGTEIVHLHGDSSTNPKLFSMMVKSKKMFLVKNYGLARARLIIAIMLLNLAVRFIGFYAAAMTMAMITKLLSHARLPRLLGRLQARLKGRLEGRLIGRLQSCLDSCLGNTASSSFSNRLSVIKAGLSGVD